ncbi:MAG: PAS domain S-box protein, partial [Deltaproteobacteria bacterium]|nr:PAS domain S-box protein [Deltaproteobacteria bacterium]
ECTYIKKDGRPFPVVLSISGLRDADGTLNGALCIAMDVTEKKRSEKALAESEQNYRFLIDNIPNIVFKGYADGTIDFFDDKIEDMTGFKRELFATRAMNWFDLIVEEDRPYVREKFVHALKTDRSYIREYRIRKKTGEIVWLEACSHIACDENGTVEFVTGAFLDVSERKRAEQALHESEEKYRSLFISGPDPIFVLDRENLKILDANPSAEETYGYYKEELIGRSFEDLGTFEYEDESFAELESKNWGQDSVFIQRVKHYRQGGESFYAEVKVCPTTYQDRPAYILASSDITEIIEKDAQLFQASKMTTLGEMSAGIAHELNQPLNAIKIGSDFLRKQIEEGKAVPPEEMHQVVTAVTGQVERASEIIQRLRDFGRKPDFKKEIVSVNSTVRDVMSIIGQQLTLQNINVLYGLDDTVPPVLVNKNRLEQVIFNLVTNARDAIELRIHSEDVPDGNTITLSTSSEGDSVVFSIEDTGVGIPEDRKEKIFEPFYTTKEVGKGMGLGLAITYGIVRDFGGEIEVESTLGMGTRIRVSLPGAENTGS